ncbi:MAG: hypothetical protein WC385_01970 [Candidatus Paceibacterota bacterium]|jgi:hypothetical protein
MAINAGGLVRLAIGAPIEWFLGFPALGIASFRLFSWLILDSTLALPAALIREGVYDLKFVDKESSWQWIIIDTTILTAYKGLSYALCLLPVWLWMGLPGTTFLGLLTVNLGLFLTTGAVNYYYVDVLDKNWLDLTERLLGWTKESKRKMVKKMPRKKRE